ncbi:hypothetical protein C7999DRAFT_18007 [Corynascus novoguineensis]|uniref:Infection structure specific protein n=1 Tax=Corynascus novoguineensis TaxID=1126955 RepID=A0AAN7HKS1_9PEZI|nr:hypothetical protein C7999DRAFT_18007 [Corynascus novoguineensis]
MHSMTSSIITILMGATVALANPAPAPVITAAPENLGPGAHLAARQFSLSDGGDIQDTFPCQTKLLSLISAVPTLPTTIASWYSSVAPPFVVVQDSDNLDHSLTSICSEVFSITPPASLSSAYSSFMSESASWASDIKSEVRSLASSCAAQPEISAVMEVLIVTDEESCTKSVVALLDAYNENTTTTKTETETTPTTEPTTERTDGSEDSPEPTTTESTGGVAAARETGLAAAAAAVAVGVAGVVAAL